MGLVLLAARSVLAVIFLRAGLLKLGDLAGFRLAVANYRLLPAMLVSAVAVILPLAESVAAVLLAVGILTGPASGLLAFLLVIFIAAIAVNLARGRVFDCGCAGASAPRRIGWGQVWVNAALALLAGAIALAPPSGLAVWPGVTGPFAVATPSADALPVTLAVLLGLVMTRVLSKATAARRRLPT